MTIAFAALLVIHGLIHLMGAAKAFGWAELSQLSEVISPAFGVVWLASTLLYVAAAVSLFAWPRVWWAIAAVAIIVSTIAIVPSWADAKAGALVNAVLAIGVAFGYLSQGPFSLRAEYDRDVNAYVSPAPPILVSEADLAHLPAPVQRYLKYVGIGGQPRIDAFRVRMRGRIRNGPDGRWMPFSSEQYNVVHPAARMFYLNASMFAIPVQGYHRYVGPSASMRIKAAALVPVVSAAGAEMTQSETVTLFNDMCLMAPGTLIDRRIEWESIDPHTVRARFTNAGYTIRADLSFNEAGELTNFVTDDRYQASPDGKTMRRIRWSTPVSGYRTYGQVRLPAGGQGIWHEEAGAYAYIELTIDDVDYRPARSATALNGGDTVRQKR